MTNQKKIFLSIQAANHVIKYWHDRGYEIIFIYTGGL